MIRALLLRKKLNELELFETKDSGGSYLYIEIPEGRVQSRWSQTPFTGAQGQDKRQWAQTEVLKDLSEHQEAVFYCKGDQRLEQVASGSCNIPYLGDINKLIWSWPGLAALATAEIGLNGTRGHFQPSQTVSVNYRTIVTTFPKFLFQLGLVWKLYPTEFEQNL